MKFSLNPRLKSVMVTLSDIEEFADILLKIAKEEHKKSLYKKEPKFEIEYRDGRAYEFIIKEEFIKQLKLSLSGIKELNLSFWGEHVDIRFSYWSSLLEEQLNLSIKSDYKEILLGYEDDIAILLKKNSGNWILHTPLIFFPLISGILIIFMLFLKWLKFISKDVLLKLNYILLLIIFALSPQLIKLYPALVIQDKENSSGRILEKDLWKMIIGIIVLIIIPILINKFF